MSGPFDATLKHLIEAHAADWLPLAGRPSSARVTVIDTDLSTVAALADKVIRVDDPSPWLLHLELQSSPTSDLADRLNWYNTLLRHSHHMPVQTLLVLLQRTANSPKLNGLYHDQFPGEEPYLTFRYQVVRLWERPVEEFLKGGTGLLPLAPLADMPEEQFPEVVRRLEERINHDVAPGEVADFWTSTLILAGIRFPEAIIRPLYERILRMRESSGYQMILEEGQTKGVQLGQLQHAHALLLRLAGKRLGHPSAEVASAVTIITDVARLDRMIERIPEVTTWDDLLQTP